MSKDNTQLIINVTGEIKSSNFIEYKKEIISKIDNIKVDLKTDDDFDEAKLTVKQLKSAEDQMIEAKSEALKQAKDVYDLFDAIDEISNKSRSTRLALSKSITRQNRLLNQQLISKGSDEVDEYYGKVCKESESFDFVMPSIGNIEVILSDCIKGLKKLKTKQSSVDSAVSELKDIIDHHRKKIESKIILLNSTECIEFSSLFQDKKSLLEIDTELLKVTIDKRIATHKASLAEKKLEESKVEEVIESKHDQETITVLPNHIKTAYSTPTQIDNVIGESAKNNSDIFLIQLQLSCSKESAVEFYQDIAKSNLVSDSHLNRKLITK